MPTERYAPGQSPDLAPDKTLDDDVPAPVSGVDDAPARQATSVMGFDLKRALPSTAETPSASKRAVTQVLMAGNLVGQTLKHFRIERRIASGGMGDVYLGTDLSLKRAVAIKTIRPELAADPDFLARFTREATAQANVVHPSVVQVYFVGEEQGVHFLAMQVVDGGSLHDSLNPEKNPSGRMSWQHAAVHMLDVCEGLVEAQRAGIVHRDIKPANILRDQAGRALLSDFGLAASAGHVDAATQNRVGAVQPSGSQLQLANVTQVGIVMGTPEYVAPEQLKAGMAVDARADMYALGATFFHLVTGTAAMPSITLMDAIARFANGQRAVPVRTLAKQVPRTFARIIDRCLEPERDARYPDMGALRDALKTALPQPAVKAGALLRAIVWAIDMLPLLALTAATYLSAWWVGPALFVLLAAFGARALHSTLGIWMMRLRLRTTTDSDVSSARAFWRTVVQNGWYVPAALGISALYASSSFDVLLVVGGLWCALSVVGSLFALLPRGQTAHDVVTNTRVLIDTRFQVNS